MSQVYDLELQALVQSTADTLGIPLKRGVYVQLTGCSYETPAEIRMLSKLGADAVGMSTVCEAIAGHHAGMRICGVSCVTNMASGILDQPLDHKEVQEIADRVSPNFKRLIGNTIKGIKF
jgi:purine-nucleoside phosphorylase